MKTFLKTLIYNLFPMMHVINQEKPVLKLKIVQTQDRREESLSFVGKERRQASQLRKNAESSKITAQS